MGPPGKRNQRLQNRQLPRVFMAEGPVIPGAADGFIQVADGNFLLQKPVSLFIEKEGGIGSAGYQGDFSVFLYCAQNA